MSGCADEQMQCAHYRVTVEADGSKRMCTFGFETNSLDFPAQILELDEAGKQVLPTSASSVYTPVLQMSYVVCKRVPDSCLAIVLAMLVKEFTTRRLCFVFHESARFMLARLS